MTLRPSETLALTFQDQLLALHRVSTILARANSLDDMLRQAVELGHTELGFERLGIWRIDPTHPEQMHGSFGIDEHGEIRDERRRTITTEQELFAHYNPNQLIAMFQDVPLFNHRQEQVGQGWLAVAALWDGDQIIGYICADNFSSQQPATSYQQELLVLFGNTLGHYCTRLQSEAERARLLVAANQRAEELEALRSIMAEISIELELPTLLQSIVERVTALLRSNTGSISMADDQSGDLEIVAIRGPGDVVAGARVRYGEGGIGQAAQRREPLLIEHYQQWSDRPNRFSEWPIETALFVPLLIGDRLLGVLAVGRDIPNDPYLDDEQHLLSLFAQQAIIAIRNAQLFTEAQHQAMVDALTGLYNRRYCTDRIESELHRSRRTGRPMALLLIDLDYFKRVNDSYGHPVGDQVLCRVAQILREAVRPGDLVGRYGGEEFLIMLPETAQAEAYKVAERVRSRLATTPIASDAGAIHMTASLGIACNLGQPGIGIEQLIDQADRNLYRAKICGRNQIVG